MWTIAGSGPSWNTPVPSGSAIYYVARHRLEAERALAGVAAAR